MKIINTTILSTEFKRNLISTAIWAASIILYIALIVFMFPFFKETMTEMMDAFEAIPGLNEIFGMDSLPITELIGFYGLEAGVIILLAGAIYSGILGSKALAKEEKEETIEFLATTPVNRKQIYITKLLMVISSIIILNIIITLFSTLFLVIVDPGIEIGKVLLFHSAITIMHLQIGLMSLALSIMFKKPSTGVGAILALGLYLFYTVLGIMDNAVLNFLEYFIPFSYADPVSVLGETIDLNFIALAIGGVITSLLIFVSYQKYKIKDLL